MKLDSYLTLYIKTNSRLINDLNIRVKTIKILYENIEMNIHDPGFDNDFRYDTISMSNNNKMDKLYFIKN